MGEVISLNSQKVSDDVVEKKDIIKILEEDADEEGIMFSVFESEGKLMVASTEESLSALIGHLERVKTSLVLGG